MRGLRENRGYICSSQLSGEGENASEMVRGLERKEIGRDRRDRGIQRQTDRDRQTERDRQRERERERRQTDRQTDREMDGQSH